MHGRCRDLNAAAARLARQAADRSGRAIVVGGSVGPTGQRHEPLGPLSQAEAVEIFAAQIEALAEGGADVAWIETMSAVEEMRAAALAATRVGLPFTLMASFHAAGRTVTGLAPEGFAAWTAGLPHAAQAIGANCGVGPADLMAWVLAIRAAYPGARIIAKANAGLPERHSDHLHYPATPALMADYARLAADAGVAIVGGCCGTSPTHLAAMREALDSHPPGEPPTLEAITRRLGPLVAPARHTVAKP